jgi:hypothetical protein
MSNFTLGLDLGQARDFSAAVIVERCVRWEGPKAEEVFADERGRLADVWLVRHIQSWALGTPYPAVVDQVGRILEQPVLRRCTRFHFDATGAGRPVADMFSDAYKRGRCGDFWPVGVTITSGERSTGTRVTKGDLVGGLQVALQEGRLRIGAGLPGAEKLRQELMDFRVKISQSGSDTYEAVTESAHDDLVVATALALLWPHHRGEPRVLAGDEDPEGALEAPA